MRADRRLLAAAVLVVGLLALPPLASAFGNPYLVTLVTRALIYALAALALDFVMGYGRLVSFGHAAFLGLGAYTVGILNTHALQALPLVGGWSGSNEALVAWPLAMLVAAAYALPVGAISLRTSGVYFIMITLAFGQLVFYLFNSLSAYGGQDGLPLWLPNTVAGREMLEGPAFYYLCLGILLVVWAFLQRVVRSPFGRVLVGCRENPRRMRALGYRPYPYQLAAFVLSAALTGLAGALLANQQTFVSPSLMHWSQSGELLVIVLLGGLATLIGPIWGALALLVLEEVLVTVTEHWQLVLGPLLVLVVLFFRNGLQGALDGRGARDD
ncbi:branched-chain amino acid ABC transporter permease [Spiribacter halobius]|uniref:Branched-chain amino acid ABC transporter permease n=1 Tax=Sediminicurvatus halobius TaxID=2182432 RepID=A0A2U2MW15_9GAMM|nr:branched-chain amino acid ABC transporter permease [Spiribacter halobius]PWG61057.1 branched-chain amino acid ABC transporter permease [Spiribacter halobius]UEX76771.1 branched-chain amino acid ABC transporter permease [Spiribacter halobius]